MHLIFPTVSPRPNVQGHGGIEMAGKGSREDKESSLNVGPGLPTTSMYLKVGHLGISPCGEKIRV